MLSNYDMTNFSFAYTSDKIRITYHPNSRREVTDVKVWSRDNEEKSTHWWYLQITKSGRRGPKRWYNFWMHPLHSVVVNCIEEYDTDALAQETRELIESIANQKIGAVVL